jgi:hypothetical protein
LRENYSLLNMGVSNNDEDGGGVDGYGSGGNSLSRQGVGTETSIPRTSSLMAVALRNFWWIDAGRFRVFAPEAFHRRKAMSEGTWGAHTTLWRGQAVTRATLWYGHLLALLCLCFGLRLCVRKNRRFGFHFVQCQEYFMYNFSEIQK